MEWGGVEWSEVKWSGVACTVIIYGSNLLAMRGGIMANCDCTVLGPSLILAGLRLCLSSGRGEGGGTSWFTARSVEGNPFFFGYSDSDSGTLPLDGHIARTGACRPSILRTPLPESTIARCRARLLFRARSGGGAEGW